VQNDLENQIGEGLFPGKQGSGGPRPRHSRIAVVDLSHDPGYTNEQEANGPSPVWPGLDAAGSVPPFGLEADLFSGFEQEGISMSVLQPPPRSPVRPAVVYPDSDGKPMADNTRQLEWIVLLFSNISAFFAERDDVFVAGNLLWYPVEGEPEVQIAPDVLVVFGRPKGYRGSYKQWEEGGVPLTVAFEILSPSNSIWEMSDKQDFYEEHGVEEYYVYDPDNNRLKVHLRRGEVFNRVRKPNGFVSPRLGISFDLSGPELVVRRPDGQPFRTLDQAEQRAARLAVLIQKIQQGALTPEEQVELQQLVQPSSQRP
jgi:Uma2 family endonuclease